ncbi:YDG domain-containing protein [Bradyrhizobium sp. STM 3562]|uniref:YDG domain-containing protein n=1 Tax=Bradyrhizobium sp. STM 3562 TaxID=578924 RepID=UPI003890B328
MNRIYKHIWSKTLGRLIVVPECVKGGQGRKAGRRRIGALLASTTALSFAGPAVAQSALPSGGQVVSGAATIATSGNAMTINQSTDRIIANWQSFSIGAGNSVTFNQPSASSVALNRVVGQDPSQILGSLTANGQVFLVNPNGIAVGKGASVQTGSFVASTLGITDENFLAGNYRFTGTGGSIVNQGNINGNVVALISPSVTNEGTIKGSTALAAGTDVLLDFNGDGLISVEVKASTMATLVQNKGLIKADGGSAILTAKGASDAMKGVVNNSGTVQAQTIGKKKGRIYLLGDMDHGEVNVSGKLDASAPNGGDGGFIETSARKVKVADNGSVTTKAASGATGTWLIDPNDYTIAASGGDISGAVLSSYLASTDITIKSSFGTQPGNGDIFVNDNVSWSANTLTLSAARNIVINSAMYASGTAGLALEYGQGAVASGNTATYTVNAPVNLSPSSVFTTKLGSDGPTTDYTIITSLGSQDSATAADLQGMRGNLSGHYVLGADIDASATSGWNSGAGFNPIGPSLVGFTGTLDGLGHTISNLTINRSTQQGVGLFGNTNFATIRNVGLVGAAITGLNSVGGLVGSSNSTTISNSSVSGSVAGNGNVGGLVGATDLGTITGSYTIAAVNGSDNVGGLVGLNFQGTIGNSHASGVTAGTNQATGGLVGVNEGAISNSYASGRVVGNDDAGGLAGVIAAGGTISNSYASGTVTGTDQVGGLVGLISSGIVSNSYATGPVGGATNVGGLVGFNADTINNSYATGSSMGFTSVGGLVGSNGGTVTASFYNAETTGRSVGCGGNSGTCSATGLTTAQMNNPFTFIDAGWDFASVWGTPTAGGAPLLRSLTTAALYDYYVRLSGSLSMVYGDSNPSLAGITLDGVGAGNVSLNWGSAITSSTNAGTYAWSGSNVLSLSYSMGSANQYYVDYGSGSLSIKKRVLGLAGSRTYDGTTDLAASIFTLNNLANGETLTLSGSGSMANKSAGTSKSLTLGTLTLGDGTGLASNYTLVGGTDTVDIQKAAISGITGITAANKIYDGTTSATLDTSGATFTGIISGDRLTIVGATGTFADKNAGVGKTVSISGLTFGGPDAGNYTIGGTATTTADIAKAVITSITGITAANKTYDGTTSAALNTSGASFTGMISGDSLTVASATGAFADKNAATGKTVTISGLTLGGMDAGNYTLAATSATTTADIAKAAISAVTGITAANKTYDGTTFAALNTSGAGFTGMIAGDSLTVAGATGAFADKNAGVGKIVTISGLTLGGADAGNYALAATTATTMADIAKAAITAVTGITAANKTYDGTTSATLDTSGAGFNGLISGDSLTLASATGAFGDKNAGVGKTVNVWGLTLGGADAGNYTLAATTATTTADIAKAPITAVAGITAANKIYDGTTNVALDTSGASFTGTILGDSLTLVGATGAFSDKNAGVGKTVTISGLTFGGADAGNYTFAGTAATTADIAKATITAIWGITANDKIFDGSTAATLNTLTARFNGMMPGDELSIGSAAAVFDSATPGYRKPVTITGLTLAGADAGNYTLADTTASSTASIVVGNTAPLLPEQIERTAVSGFGAPTALLLDPGPTLVETSNARSWNERP